MAHLEGQGGREEGGRVRGGGERGGGRGPGWAAFSGAEVLSATSMTFRSRK